MTGRKHSPPIEILVAEFPRWVSYFESNGPFRRPEQLKYHRKTIERRFELGSAAAAATDEEFQRALYSTLSAWGIGSRRSRLKPFSEFATIISRQQDALARFDSMMLDDALLDVESTADALWTLLSELPIVDNAAKIVAVTKALHHLLPELVVPMDRQYTQTFFGWHNPQFQKRQRQCFAEAFSVFARVARAVNPSSYVNKSWNSSRTKVIDNGLVGLVQWVKDHPTPPSH